MNSQIKELTNLEDFKRVYKVFSGPPYNEKYTEEELTEIFREYQEKGYIYAAKYDRKVIMEEAIDGGRFACAMLKKGKLHISSIGEIVTRAKSKFRSFNSRGGS